MSQETLQLFPLGICVCPECSFQMGHSTDFVGKSDTPATVVECINEACGSKGKKFKLETITVRVTEIE